MVQVEGLRVDLNQKRANPEESWDKDWEEVWSRYYWRLLPHYKSVEPYLHGPVLDVGCGPGFLAASVFPNYHWYTGIDISPKAVEVGSMLFPGANFRVGDVENNSLPFSTDSFRTVVCTEVLEHIERHDIIVPELVRVAQEYVVITVPTNMPGAGHIYPVWSHEQFRTLAARMGTVIEVHSYYETKHHLAWIRKRR